VYCTATCTFGPTAMTRASGIIMHIATAILNTTNTTLQTPRSIVDQVTGSTTNGNQDVSHGLVVQRSGEPRYVEQNCDKNAC
jgi:hypothetical protein